eukprot:66216-Amphidinium_carterae.1
MWQKGSCCCAVLADPASCGCSLVHYSACPPSFMALTTSFSVGRLTPPSGRGRRRWAGRCSR